MFRPLRRSKKAIDDDAARYLLKTARRGVLAVNGDDGYPYAVPVNYLYIEEENSIVFHGAAKGHKADAVERDSKVCFTVYGTPTVKDDLWAPYVRSVVVFGRCTVTEDRARTEELVKRFAMKYYPDEATADSEIAESGKAVRMYEIKIEHMTGKEIQEK